MRKQGLSLNQLIQRVKGSKERDKIEKRKKRENQLKITETQIVRNKKRLVFLGHSMSSF